MNVFNLFKTNNVSSIKLGIQIIKTLGLEREFGESFNREFVDYQDVFNNVFLTHRKTPSYYNINIAWEYHNCFIRLYNSNMDLSSLSKWNIELMIIVTPQLKPYFDK